MTHLLLHICASLNLHSNFYSIMKNIHYSFPASLSYLYSFHRPLTNLYISFIIISFEHSFCFSQLLFAILRILSGYLLWVCIHFADLYFFDYITAMSVIYFNFMRVCLLPLLLYCIGLSKITPS